MTVYFIQAGGEDGPVKVGWCKGDPDARMRELQVGNSVQLRLLACCPGGRDLEAAFHRVFAEARLRGEWFAPSPCVLVHAGVPPDLWPALDEDLRPLSQRPYALAEDPQTPVAGSAA